jgi:hypothetical protein
MVMTHKKTLSVDMKKWMFELSKSKKTTTSSRQRVNKSGSLKTIRRPTKEDYEDVPEHFRLGQPSTPWHELRKVLPLMKRLHDQYMRASSVGIDAIIASISEITFLSGPSKVVVDFEDIHLMFCLKTQCPTLDDVVPISVTRTIIYVLLIYG